jgi:hypothetical protein
VRIFAGVFLVVLFWAFLSVGMMTVRFVLPSRWGQGTKFIYLLAAMLVPMSAIGFGVLMTRAVVRDIFAIP